MILARDESTGKSFCDGVTRRDFLRVGGLGLAGLTWADLLRPRAQGAGTSRRRCRSVIMIMLSGGPSHVDTYDVKPEAPAEYRGEFRSIPTALPGVRLCEYLPLQAKLADKLALVRSLEMGFNDHQNQCEILSGFPAQVMGGRPVVPFRPVFGSVISRLGPLPTTPLPRYVSLSAEDPDRLKQQDPAYAGLAHRPFVPDKAGLANLRLAPGISADRLANRKQLLKTFDALKRECDVLRDLQGFDPYTAQAFEMLSSDKVRDAFDISKEPLHVRELYGNKALDKKAQVTTGGYRWDHERFLQARRLVEAGVPVVTIFLSGWDHHGRVDNEKLGVFEKLQGTLPTWDRYLHGLVTDLHERGLDQEVAVLAWGEFGRTPKIDRKHVGRDHWPSANIALLAGGGMRVGQVIGATDARGEKVTARPLTAQNVLATVYQLLGVDPDQTLPDQQGRPMHLLEDREPIRELI